MNTYVWIAIGFVAGVLARVVWEVAVQFIYLRKAKRADWLAEPPPTVEAEKFRIRTAEADPNRRARVRTARILAKKGPDIPGPRR